MGNSVRVYLKKIGCTEKLLSFFFDTNFDHLVQAIQFGDLNRTIYYHKEKNVNFMSYLHSNGNNALHVAVYYGRINIVSYILNNVKGLDLEDKNFDGDTVFMISAIKQRLEIMKMLVDFSKNRLDIDTQENQGNTAFIIACCNNNIDFLNSLFFDLKVNFRILNSEGQSGVHRASQYGNLNVLIFLRKNTDLSFSAKDSRGDTPGHLAARRFHIKCVRFIMRESKKKKGTMYISNSKGETPLSILVSILNRIKDAKMAEVIEDDVMHYLENKHNYPKTKKDEQVVRASLNFTHPKIEEQANLENQSSSILVPSSSSSDLSSLKLTLINRRKKKPIPLPSSPPPLLSPPSQDSSPISPFKNFFNKVKSPFAVKKKDPISFQETIKDLEEGASFIKMRIVEEEGEKKEEEGGRMKEEIRMEEERGRRRRRGEKEEEGTRTKGGRGWREDEEGEVEREDESKEKGRGGETEEGGGEEGGGSMRQVFGRRKVEIKVKK